MLRNAAQADSDEVDVLPGEPLDDWSEDRSIGKVTSTEAEAPHPKGAPTVRMHRFPRKEVIQPQLPLRLPCYDFTPVTSSAFDRSLPCGLGHGLRAYPTSVV